MLTESITAEPVPVPTAPVTPSPSRNVHSTRARGVAQINYLLWPEEKAKMKKYCRQMGISMTDLIKRGVSREMAANPRHPAKP